MHTHHLSLPVMPSYQSVSRLDILMRGSGHSEGVTFKNEPCMHMVMHDQIRVGYRQDRAK
jgi:hypothetical protein